MFTRSCDVTLKKIHWFVRDLKAAKYWRIPNSIFILYDRCQPALTIVYVYIRNYKMYKIIDDLMTHGIASMFVRGEITHHCCKSRQYIVKESYHVLKSGTNVCPFTRGIYFGQTEMSIYISSFLYSETALIVEIMPGRSQELNYRSKSIPLLLMAWRRKDSGHQQP